jgi:hypothetical protein
MDREKEPFKERHEFAGTIQAQGRSVEGVIFDIDYSRIRDGSIGGSLYGSVDVLGRLQGLESADNLFVRSTDHRSSISSKTAYLRTLLSYPMSPTRPIGVIRFENLEVATTLPDDVETERRAIFFLAGSRRVWPATDWTQASSKGYLKMDVEHSEIAVGGESKLAITVQPRLEFQSPRPSSLEPSQFVTVYTMEFRDKEGSERLTSEEFLAYAIQAADDLTWVASLLSTHRTTWFAYDFIRERSSTYFVRSVPECSSTAPSWSFHLVHDDGGEALCVGFGELRRLRKSGIDLQLPIVNYIAGNEAKFVEQKFSSYFLALESMKDMYLDSRGMGPIIRESDFKSLRDAVAVLIDKSVTDPKAKSEMMKKVTELNRPPLRTSLEEMASETKVKWTDLYPENAEFSLLNTRNQLFHTAKKFDIDHLARETERTRILVERLLLGFLGLTDLSRPLDVGLLDFLRERPRS